MKHSAAIPFFHVLFFSRTRSSGCRGFCLVWCGRVRSLRRLRGGGCDRRPVFQRLQRCLDLCVIRCCQQFKIEKLISRHLHLTSGVIPTFSMALPLSRFKLATDKRIAEPLLVIVKYSCTMPLPAVLVPKTVVFPRSCKTPAKNSATPEVRVLTNVTEVLSVSKVSSAFNCVSVPALRSIR